MKKIYLTLGLIMAIVQITFAQAYYSTTWPANSGSANWVNLGTISMMQDGNDGLIRIYGGSGYSANTNQMGYIELHIRTSNGVVVDGNGFGFAATAVNYGRGGASFISQFHIVPNNAGTAATAFTVYAFCGPFLGGSPYVVETSGTWTSSNTIVASDPGGYVVPFEFFVNNNSYLMGNVGIGTSAPKSTLQITGTLISGGANANIDPSIAANIPGNLPNTGQMLIGWNRSAGSGETDFIANQGVGAPGGFAFYNHNNSNVETQLMWIRGDGTVGIGTSAPGSYKLAVAGGIHAQQVNVDLSGWSDYVFDKGYHLPTLAETEAYINQNHHLAEIPSAAEIAKNGLNLGEMNKLLLKKVEELTLYLIEKDKEVKEEHSKNDCQQRQIDQLKKQMELLFKNQ